VVSLHCHTAARDVPGVQVVLHRGVNIGHRFQFSPGQFGYLREAARTEDIVHNHSLWAAMNIAAGWAVPGRKAKLVCAPRGTLATWALRNGRWKKRLAWPLQRQLLRRSDLFHATCDDEYQEIRRLGLRSPVAIVPNGIDIPAASARGSQREEVILFLSRIHPKKGIEILLDAWGLVADQQPEWRLQITGPGATGYVESLRKRATGLPRVTLTGPVFGEDKSALYRRASLFVLPTHSENFGMVVAEALAHGCPAIVSQHAPWSGLISNRCGWSIANDASTLAETMLTGMLMPARELEEMGERGREWMQREFSWDGLALQMDAAYRWLLDGGSPPECVRLD
jgi:glycosyltransferase involved in cell wall biosynthesis